MLICLRVVPQVLSAELAAAAQLLHFVPTAASLKLQGCEAALIMREDSSEPDGHVRASPQHTRLVMQESPVLERSTVLPIL